MNEMIVYLNMFESVYAERDGPYILGQEVIHLNCPKVKAKGFSFLFFFQITYTDFLIYHLIDDEEQTKKLDGYPNLNKFVRAFEERSNIKKYLATLEQN